MSEAKYHVIGNAYGSPWVLNLEPQTLAKCQRDIAWQRVGQGQFDPAEYWQITEYEPSQGFVNADGATFVPGKGPYTDAAWAGFWERYGDGEPRHCDDCGFTTTEQDVTCCPDKLCRGTVG